MRKLFFVLSILIITTVIISFKSKAQFEHVAVIELFTSQGCSSCPPADQLLTKTITDAGKDGKKVFALSFHVDYWNRLGWSDPFSNKLFSQRQKEYASVMDLSSVYTPQMIVNGTWEFVGSDESELKNSLTKALNTTATAGFKILTVTIEEGNAPHLQYALDGDYTGCKINFALVSLSETTHIGRGENGGLTLENQNVVRQFISEQAKESGDVSFASTPLPAKNNMAVIAYIQNNKDLKIIGAAIAEMK